MEICSDLLNLRKKSIKKAAYKAAFSRLSYSEAFNTEMIVLIEKNPNASTESTENASAR